jgi:hypothetical protein
MPDMIRTVLVEQKMIYEERIAELIKERDEARRTLCFIQSQVRGCTPWYHAERQGWDCFKENDKEETK